MWLLKSQFKLISEEHMVLVPQFTPDPHQVHIWLLVKAQMLLYPNEYFISISCITQLEPDSQTQEEKVTWR